MQPHLDGVSVLKRNGGARAFVRRRVRCLAALPQPHQHRFDVLAGSQRIDGEIRAGTIVLEQAGPAHRDAVGAAAGRLDLVVAVNSRLRAVSKPSAALPWPCPAVRRSAVRLA